MAIYEWSVVKTSFSRLDLDLRQLASAGFEIYQIIAVQEIRPAKVPFEVVVISRKCLPSKPAEPPSRAFDMHYQPAVQSSAD